MKIFKKPINPETCGVTHQGRTLYPAKVPPPDSPAREAATLAGYSVRPWWDTLFNTLEQAMAICMILHQRHKKTNRND